MSILRATRLLSALAAFCVPAPAGALPFFFDEPADGGHPAGFGFDPTHPDIIATTQILVGPGATSHTAGDPSDDPDLDVTTQLVQQPTVPVTPSVLDPILAEVEYTVTNTTGAPLEDAYLVFALAVLDDWPAVQPHEFGIDQMDGPADPWELVVLLRVDYGGGHEHVFAAVRLPDLAADAVHGFQIKHLVGDSLGSSTEIPTPGLSLLQHVPEPPAALLVLLPALAAAALRRPR